ncbi:MAG: serine/threonine phosphatase [Caldanaerobacter subterraneus]|uniref:Protein serine/threonine phosphatases n=2 Tax=Caldanaerobacter subterraneus TaxID=911092 RepID=Q8R9T5_CALS4|nr:Stp1/IreP family PP2C-type Ser/Thr phosphatase [Caldanaerobacter subterraneus]AAM24719.1 Protein serine/threonine phosphatases [Caldanaerobacter subterraneus subsp. tengcongensis MB4]KUK09937.1 MAG: serine/threonine phosphatase [Caldanaerobacter subterraneus]MBE3579176.1 Stp1/IreP family PP2C-type Ser/Thr phosphatase [Caldanaerobacter subterraneus]MCS3915717.1 protein phosphatase [Caldanaerobacter subterraneus subsp. tengcongensis MB4]HBT49481.1 Stp1/IreP family PP2C-type Ser/Thr phosphatas
MIVAALTDIGNFREKNEDYYYASFDENFPLFIVADGMGGHNGGEIASKLAVESVVAYFKDNYPKLKNKEVSTIREFIESSVKFANKVVYQHACAECDLVGMGTTLTLLFFEKNHFFIGHIGDSRAYLIRDSKIVQITEDHSFVEELVKMGKITHEEARIHPQRNIITRALGVDEDVEVDTFYGDVLPQDILCLCTDGLTNLVADEEILKEFSKNHDINRACENLVNMAKENGGYDNITIVAVKEVTL